MSKYDATEIDADSIEEVRQMLKYALDNKSWIDVEDALGFLNETLGYDPELDEEEGTKKRNHLEE